MDQPRYQGELAPGRCRDSPKEPQRVTCSQQKGARRRSLGHVFSACDASNVNLMVLPYPLVTPPKCEPSGLGGSSFDGEYVWANSRRAEIEMLLRPGALSLIVGERSASTTLLRDFAEILGTPAASATLVLTEPTTAGSLAEVERRMSGVRLAYDLEMLLWRPWHNIAPVRLLWKLARYTGRVAVWPGEAKHGRLRFSAPGRQDYVDADARGVTIIRVQQTRFPDEVPYVFEGTRL
jgi:hypothetical protein